MRCRNTGPLCFATVLSIPVRATLCVKRLPALGRNRLARAQGAISLANTSIDMGMALVNAAMRSARAKSMHNITPRSLPNPAIPVKRPNLTPQPLPDPAGRRKVEHEFDFEIRVPRG